MSDQSSTRQPVCPALHSFSTLQSPLLEMEADAASEHDHPKSSSVKFSKVHVRKYKVVIGDHPLCKEGCPLSLGWNYTESPSIDVDEFEELRIDQRRTRNHLRMSSRQREEILSNDGGYSLAEIRQANRKLFRSRCQPQSLASSRDLQSFFAQ